MSFVNKEKQPILIKDLFKGSSCFLVLGGKSLLDIDLSLLSHPSIMTMGVNNSPSSFRPRLWTMVDDIKNFIQSIYTDPGIIKFLPQPKHSHKLWDNIHWKESEKRIHECPGVIYYQRNDTDKHPFHPDTFLTDTKFCWGNHEKRCECGWMRQEKITTCCNGDCKHTKFRHDKCRKCGWERPKYTKQCKKCGEKDMWGCRSVMLVATRILYELGFSRVYLLGCDFKMVHGEQNYHFDQERSAQAVKNNNNSYKRLNIRFDRLRPVFERSGMEIFNCNEDSGLKSFDYKSYNDCIDEAKEHIPEDEITEGMYDRKAKLKEKEKAEKKKKQMKESSKHKSNQMTMEEFARICK